MPLKPDPFLTLSNNLLRLILRIVKYKLKCCECKKTPEVHKLKLKINIQGLPKAFTFFMLLKTL